MTSRLILVVFGLAALAGCGDNRVPAPVYGQQLFGDPKLSDSPANAYACSTCHSSLPGTDPARLDPGYSLYDAASRPSWWGHYEIDFLDAVNFCRTSFMDAEVPLSPDQPKAKALYEYLVEISPDQAALALPLSPVKYVVEIPRGDPMRGQAVYVAACARCHGDYGTGKGKLTDAMPVLPDVILAYPGKYPGLSVPQLVIEKVRHGNFFGLGGTMPPYSKEALSDADLGALLAYFGL